VSGGDVFLARVGAIGSIANLKICKDGSCEFNSSKVGAYRLKDGVLSKFIGGRWVNDNVLFRGNLSLIKSNWEFYNGALKFLENINPQNGFHPATIGFLGKPKDTRKFILYGDGTGIGGDVVAVWQNNIWQIKRGPKSAKGSRKLIYIGGNDSVALQMFYKIVTSGMNDNVYWEILTSNKSYDEKSDRGFPVGVFVGTGSWTKLDSDKKLEGLVAKFNTEKSELLSEINPTLNEVRSLNLSGRIVNICGTKFVVNVHYLNNGGIVIGFVSGSKKFGLKYFPYGKTEALVSDGDYSALHASSFILVKPVKSWAPIGNENFYKLYKQDFMDEFLGNLSLIKSNWEFYNGALKFLENINPQNGFHPATMVF